MIPLLVRVNVPLPLLTRLVKIGLVTLTQVVSEVILTGIKLTVLRREITAAVTVLIGARREPAVFPGRKL